MDTYIACALGGAGGDRQQYRGTILATRSVTKHSGDIKVTLGAASNTLDGCMSDVLRCSL